MLCVAIELLILKVIILVVVDALIFFGNKLTFCVNLSPFFEEAGVCSQHCIFFVTYKWPHYARVFVPSETSKLSGKLVIYK
jgi:hypothetical protein